jgi:hypothetical protein
LGLRSPIALRELVWQFGMAGRNKEGNLGLFDSSVKSVFLFVLDLDSKEPSNPPEREPARSNGRFSKSLLETISKELTKRHYRLSDVESDKLGMAGCAVTLPNYEVDLTLGVQTRPTAEVTLRTYVRLGSARQVPPAANQEWAEFCDDLERTLLERFKLDSLQRLTQREAESLWSARQQARRVAQTKI